MIQYIIKQIIPGVVSLPEKEMLNPSYDIEKSDIKRNWALKFP